MTSLEVREGPWHVMAATEHKPAAYVTAGSLSYVETVIHAPSRSAKVRSVVELRALSGGLRPRGLVGGEFTSTPSAEFRVEVGHSGALGSGAAACCPSLLGGAALVAGLPLEFAQAALDGLMRAQCAEPMPAGVLRVDRAAHDEVESAQMVFDVAGGVLRCLLGAAARGDAPDDDEVRRLLRS